MANVLEAIGSSAAPEAKRIQGVEKPVPGTLKKLTTEEPGPSPEPTDGTQLSPLASQILTAGDEPGGGDDPTLPADLQDQVGTVGYYEARAEDFRRRHPGQEPPDYYMEYGDKYAKRFTEELRPKLSEEGQQWLDRTFVLLQQAIEDKRREDPAAFDQLEQNPEAFKEFAYSTHSRAYLDAGLADLPPEDLYRIVTTPDLKDLFTKAGLSQIVETIPELAADWAGDAVEGAQDLGERAWDWAGDRAGDAVDKGKEGVDWLRKKLPW
ncbi:MAG: hypothetical protein HYU64_03950 [Armatimonadetes bacterium]|nr:hypothetical protein [Armatimonadota bacterium]